MLKLFNQKSVVVSEKKFITDQLLNNKLSKSQHEKGINTPRFFLALNNYFFDIVKLIKKIKVHKTRKKT